MKKKKLLPFKILFFTSLGMSALALITYMIMNAIGIEENAAWRFVNG